MIGESREKARETMLQRCSTITRNQLTQGPVGRVEKESNGKTFYVPHKPLVRKTAESTKIRIVYDASAQAYDKQENINPERLPTE